MVKHYNRKIPFQPFKSKLDHFGSYLVFNSMADVGSAVMQACFLGKADKTRDVALSLQSDVQKAHNDSNPLPWHPSAQDLKNADITLPEDLESSVVSNFWKASRKSLPNK